jgi:hypothetical protein
MSNLIDEKTGESFQTSDCIILDGVGSTSDYRRLCTRAIYSHGRELWLEKIDAPDVSRPTAPGVNPWSRG